MNHLPPSSRLVLKIVLAVAMIALLCVFSKDTVDFVYTGF